jgi:translation initiation factor 1
MSEICSRCGLPQELCVCEDIAKETQTIRVFLEKKRFGKISTIIEGIEGKNINVKEVAKKLKNEFACGGTYKDNHIELQGDHSSKIRKSLERLGFDASSVEIIQK